MPPDVAVEKTTVMIGFSHHHKFPKITGAIADT